MVGPWATAKYYVPAANNSSACMLHANVIIPGP